jgi:hypothetical protein
MKNNALTWDVICEPSADPARWESWLADDEDSVSAAAGGCGHSRGEPAAAERADGIPGISGERLAMLLRAVQRDDAEVRREVQRALVFDAFVPLSVQARVEDGIVTLTGIVSRPGERDDAVLLTSCVPGVLGIMDKLVVAPAQRKREADAG